MGVTQVSRLLPAEQIAVNAGAQVPFLRLPVRAEVFAERGIRLRQLAAGHAMRDYLLFMAELAEAQHRLLCAVDLPALALPTAAQIDEAAQAGQALLPAARWPRDPAWRGLLRRLLDGLAPRLVGSPALAVVEALKAADDDELERQADRLLGGTTQGLDLGAAPLIAAALQVNWTQLVLATEAAQGPGREPAFGRTDDVTRCPCCASLPVSAITRIGDASGFRYLHCSLCSSQWHLVRIKCARCESTKGIHYQSLEPLPGQAVSAHAAAPAAVQAECCESCGHYLKIVHMEKDREVDPVADDLATLTLDMLVSESGLQRHGANLMLLFGDPEDADPDERARP